MQGINLIHKHKFGQTMISREDVLSVADSINMEATEAQIQFVLQEYPYAEAADPTATWDLIVENLLYSYSED